MEEVVLIDKLEKLLKETAKINVNTELQAWTEVVRDLLKMTRGLTLENNWSRIAGIRKVVKEKIKLFGSDNRI